MFGYKKVTEGTCLQIHSQKERDDLGFIESHKDQMPYIKKMVTQIEKNMIRFFDQHSKLISYNKIQNDEKVTQNPLSVISC